MTGVGRICRCGKLLMPTGALHSCLPTALARRAEGLRRHEKQREQGRDSAYWKQLREAVLERDGHACQFQLRGCTDVATTVHLRPELHGDHHAATLEDCESACASCHGIVDAPRAQRGGGSSCAR